MKKDDTNEKILLVLAAVLFGLIATAMIVGHAHTLLPKGNERESQRSTEEIYAKECATCHGTDGRAKTFKSKFTHARNFTDAQWQDTVSDERLFNSITNGKGKMPAWGKKLSEAEINSLVKYVRAFKK